MVMASINFSIGKVVGNVAVFRGGRPVVLKYRGGPLPPIRVREVSASYVYQANRSITRWSFSL